MPTITQYKNTCGNSWKQVFWPDPDFKQLLHVAWKNNHIKNFSFKILDKFPDEFQTATGYKDKSSAQFTARLYLCAFRTFGAVPVRGQSDFTEMDTVLQKLSSTLHQVASEYSSLYRSFGLYTELEDVHLMLKEYVDELSRLGFSFKSVF